MKIVLSWDLWLTNLSSALDVLSLLSLCINIESVVLKYCSILCFIISIKILVKCCKKSENILIFVKYQKIIKQSQSSFRYCYHLLGEEIDFLSLRNEFSTVSPEGLGSILRFPCGEIIKNSFRRNENSISSPQEWELNRFEHKSYCTITNSVCQICS